ncbi:MAG: hypothetical protein AAFQ36_09365 [Pseudomonadota bacterium]
MMVWAVAWVTVKLRGNSGLNLWVVALIEAWMWVNIARYALT